MRLFNEDISSPEVAALRYENGFDQKSSPSTASYLGSTPTSGKQWKIRQISKIPSFDEDSGLGMDYDMVSFYFLNRHFMYFPMMKSFVRSN